MKGLRIFAVAFAFSVLVASIAATFVVKSVDGTLQSVFTRRSDDLANILSSTVDQNKETDSGETDDTNPLKKLEGNSFSLLLVCTDYRPDVYDNYLPESSGAAGDKKAGTDKDKDSKDNVGIFENGVRLKGVSNICLVQCSKEYGEYVFTPISPITNVYTPTGYMTLSDVYGIYDFDYLREKIESITGTGIDFYAAINCTDIKSMVDIIGAVFCDVPCEIYTDGTEYISLSAVSKIPSKDAKKYKSFLKPCSDNIGPSSMGLLLFKDYANGIGEELSITESYTKGIIKNFAKLTQNGQNAIWQRLSAYMSATNIDSSFFDSEWQLIAAYSDDIASTLTYPGRFKPSAELEDSTFEPDITKAIAALSKYRQ